MEPQARQQHARLVEYDAMKKRLWILGQRCHHGATGALVAAAACVGLAAERDLAGRILALAATATGGALMVHDWKDHTIWFERGYGSQM